MLPWIILIAYILLLLAIDFFVLHKANKKISAKKALFETLFFVLNAFIFAGILYWCYTGSMVNNPNELTPYQALVKYLTGYVIELSLSVDNLFVIAVIFASFKIPNQYQHKLLYLGILGALVFRAILISVGLVLINKIEAMTIVFGLFLLYTALKMLKKEDENSNEPKGWMKLFRFSKELDGGKFVMYQNGKRVFTALFGALITIEFTDLLFALDSIPAIFSITTDPFIVYSSNIFAIMGLRSLFFFLSTMLDKFDYLKYSIFFILLFVSLKLMTTNFIEIPEWISLAFIVFSLGVGIVASIIKMRKTN